jgi:hypothetical protein
MRYYLGWVAIACSIVIYSWFVLCLFASLQEFDFDYAQCVEVVFVNNWVNIALVAAVPMAATTMLCIGLAQIAHPRA